MLVNSGAISADDLQRSLAIQLRTRAKSRLGEVLLANGLVRPDEFSKVLARQYGIGRIDLAKAPIDPGLLDNVDPLICLRLGYVPWRRIGETTIIALSDPEKIKIIAESAPVVGGKLAFAIADAALIEATLLHFFQRNLADRANTLCPAEYSCRTIRSRFALPKMIFIAGFAGWLALNSPTAAICTLLIFLTLTNLGTAVLRVLAFGAMAIPRRSEIGSTTIRDPSQRALPRISVLVPLFREPHVLKDLLGALHKLDYPRALLDVKLILETDDDDTSSGLLEHDLPPWIDVILVPKAAIRTKPRAMNYALPLCKGDIVGIYDAEDRPEADQLRKVAYALAQAPAKIACVQGALDFYNTRQNWLSRCFAIEYAQWFRVLLPGLHRLGLPIPLGGTTVFFRRDILEKLGGWDAHNVTEDADLGMRLARFGYSCGILPSTTFEEASCRPKPWVRQRSRWLKGYAMTWSSHMRHPLKLLDDLGPLAFLTFQIIFLGTLASYLALPLHLLLWANVFGVPVPLLDALPPDIWFWFVTSHLTGLIALVLVVSRALAPKSHRHLALYVLSLPFYAPLGAIASWRALIGSILTPYYWAKTEHGAAIMQLD